MADRIRAMKLRDWMKEEGHDDASFAKAFRDALGPSGRCSPRTVEKWRSGERIPRKRSMPVIGKLTQKRVRAEDFFTEEPSKGSQAL